MQLFRGGFGLRPALHVQLVEDVADVGLHGRQLHIHDLRDLGICSRKLKQSPHIVRVKKQVVGLQHRYQSGIVP